MLLQLLRHDLPPPLAEGGRNIHPVPRDEQELRPPPEQPVDGGQHRDRPGRLLGPPPLALALRVRAEPPLDQRAEIPRRRLGAHPDRREAALGVLGLDHRREGLEQLHLRRAGDGRVAVEDPAHEGGSRPVAARDHDGRVPIRAPLPLRGRLGPRAPGPRERRRPARPAPHHPPELDVPPAQPQPHRRPQPVRPVWKLVHGSSADHGWSSNPPVARPVHRVTPPRLHPPAGLL